MKAMDAGAEHLVEAIVAMTSDVGTSANVDRVAGYSVNCRLEIIWNVGPDTLFWPGHKVS